jgi:hypothetical protein
MIGGEAVSAGLFTTNGFGVPPTFILNSNFGGALTSSALSFSFSISEAFSSSGLSNCGMIDCGSTYLEEWPLLPND